MADYILESTWAQVDAAAKAEPINKMHRESASNPHNVTKADVGLDKVDNISVKDMDISDKVQAELDKKEDKLLVPTKDDQVLSSKTDGTKTWISLPKTGIQGLQSGNGINILNNDPFNPTIEVDLGGPTVVDLMSKSVYDTNRDGVVDRATEADNAKTVNNLTVETAVPVGAVFTDTHVPVINDLTTGGTDALSAEMGKTLNGKITDKKLSELSDVNVDTAIDGQVLQKQGTQWVAQEVLDLGGF